MQSTQLVCPHCGSTLTFGAAISSGAAVECLICMKAFTAAKPVTFSATAMPAPQSSASAKANPKSAPTTFSTTPMAARPAKPRRPAPKVRRPVEANGSFVVIAVSIACVVLLTGGISFAIWKAMRTAGPVPADPDEAPIAKKGGPTELVDKKLPPVEEKKPAGGGKPLATSEEDDEDIRAKFREEIKQVLARKAPSTIDGKEPDWEVNAPEPPKNAAAGDHEKINKAIGRGIAYLRMMQTWEGSWTGGGHDVGYTALCGLTLLECKVLPRDPAIQRAAAFIRARCAKLDFNYEVALAVLFLDRLGDPNDRPVIQGLALRLMAAQDQGGAWSYTTAPLSPEEMGQLYAFMRPNVPLYRPVANPKIRNPLDPFQRLRFLLLSKGLDADRTKDDLKNPPKVNEAPPPPMQVEALDAKLKDLPIVQHRGKRKGDLAVVPNFLSDNSNTQFALLALWAARRHGVPTDQALLAGYQRFAMTQHPTDHGWGYPGPSTNTMTCVGLIGLGIGHGVSPDREVAGPNTGTVRPALQHPGIQAGLQALARNIGQPSADAKKAHFPMENLYFLWSVERVAMLYDLDTIGGKDWYGWGAQVLIPNQRADGSWQSAAFTGSQISVDTCFALLFLKRSNLVQDLTRNLRLKTAVRDP